MNSERVIKFIETFCTHVKGEWARKPFILDDWQKTDIIDPLYGTLNDFGLRQYRTAYIQIPRKNGKSNLIAALGLYHLFADKEPGAEVIVAAGDRSQAGIIHEIQKQMVMNSPILSKKCKVYRNSIVLNDDSSFIQAISADANTKHGYSISCCLFDEVHTQPNRELWDVLTTATGARRQPLTLAITTAGHDKQSICYELYDYARKVKEGIIDDASFLPVLYETEDGDDIHNEQTWRKVNPGLGTSLKLEYIQQQSDKAKQLITYENTFRRLHLNQWTSSEEKWVSDEDFMSGCTDFNPEDFHGMEAWGGLDLAATEDITAFVLIIPDGDGFKVILKAWVTEAAVIRRRGRTGADYDAFVRKGLLTVTDGNSTDYRILRRDIIEMCEEYNVKGIAFDRWNSSTLIPDLVDDGLECYPFGQGFASMSAPVKNLEILIRSGNLDHGGNELLRWMCSNIQIKKDPAENLKFDKAKSSDKIDGMVALAMAMGQYMIDRADDKDEDTIYGERDILIL
jgi:phage terminase large subunit-like protein